MFNLMILIAVKIKTLKAKALYCSSAFLVMLFLQNVLIPSKIKEVLWK